MKFELLGLFIWEDCCDWERPFRLSTVCKDGSATCCRATTKINHFGIGVKYILKNYLKKVVKCASEFGIEPVFEMPSSEYQMISF